MISEADAREAARHLSVARDRLSKMGEEDFEFKSIARDMDNHAWRLACFAVDELARREAERVEQKDAVDQFAVELRKWWSFDNAQNHTHSYHAREDFIAKKLPDLLAAMKGGEM